MDCTGRAMRGFGRADTVGSLARKKEESRGGRNRRLGGSFSLWPRAGQALHRLQET